MARALLNRPELLILDEPTTGLDPQSRHQVWERLEELRAGGLSILLTSHYMEEASRLLAVEEQRRDAAATLIKQALAPLAANPDHPGSRRP
jgi:ABC-type molybdenum transport system ATPase subunit/photorepair protein PhrA